jgi:hypothetical protein
MNQEINVELNLFYMHYNDAKMFAKWAEERQNEKVNPSIYSRHAIISTVFASEALINRVINEWFVTQIGAKVWAFEGLQGSGKEQ